MSDGGKWPAALKRSGDSYLLQRAASAWEVWQARAALDVTAGAIAACREISKDRDLTLGATGAAHWAGWESALDEVEARIGAILNTGKPT